MTLKDRITADMKDAMRAKESARLSTIRLLLAAIKQREVDERKTLSDADVVAVIDRMVKQRKDSIEQFEAGNRRDLADAERAELALLTTYIYFQNQEYYTSMWATTGGKITLILGVALQIVGVFIIYRMMASTEDNG